MSKTVEGAGTQIRWGVLAAGIRTRPLVADLDLLTGVTTSDWTGTETEKTDPKDYESAAEGWADGYVSENGWSMSLSANKKKDTAQAAQLEALRDAWADRAEIWIERLLPESDTWEGGVASVKGPKLTSPADGAITFTCTFTGRGAPVYTADV